MRFTGGIICRFGHSFERDSRYPPTQVTFTRLHTVKVRLYAKAFAQVARCWAQSHAARMLSVFLVTEENHVGAQGVGTL
jgi:hypothetical protein